MSSNNQVITYPDLTNSSTSPPDGDSTSNVTGENVQQSVNGASNETSSQVSSSRRHLRSSGPVLDHPLDSLITDEVTSEQRQNEIVVVPGRTFLRRLFDALRKPTTIHRITYEMKADLLW